MVAGRGERIGHAGEQILAVVLNERGLTVHHAVVYDDAAAEDMTNALVPQTNAERRDAWAEGANDFIRESGFARRARPRRDENALRRQRSDLLNRDPAVAMDLHFHLHLPQVLHQVVGE